MIAKGKAGRGATRPASKTAFTERNSTAPDPLIGWFDLAKPSRNRQQKRTWKRGNQRGRIDAHLVAHLALFFILALLIVGGLANA